MKAYRERMKLDRVKDKQMKEKDKIRKKIKREKAKELMDKLPTSAKQNLIIERRDRDLERQRRCRERKG